jgi:MFS family permease
MYTCAFLIGAAVGGLIFGWLGDRIGRARAMGMSILWYGLFIGIVYLVETPARMSALIFLSCLGVGGMWPNGVALVSEAWPNVSRPTLSGLIGASANLGFMLNAWFASTYEVTVDSWRWMMIVGMIPGVILGVLVLVLVPESPSWLAGRSQAKKIATRTASPVRQVFSPPLLKYTLLGIALGTIPTMGNWGSANWTVPWADQVGAPELKGHIQFMKSAGGALGALCGGWAATLLGRRLTYFLISLASLLISSYIFGYLNPLSPQFGSWVFAIGFSGTLYFGWLPLFLPELFPTSVRATGTGVSFNFGRILTAVGTIGTGRLMVAFEDYARAGQITCLVYVLGMLVILLAPDTSKKGTPSLERSSAR